MTADRGDVAEPEANAGRAGPENLLAWVAGYAIELSGAGGGPLRRIAVAAGDTKVEVEWSAPRPQRGPAPARAAAFDGAPPMAGDALAADLSTADLSDVDLNDSERIIVCAPMVGTFYRSPEPGAPPFVQAGDLVEAGQQVGIVEAMKLMNPILAEHDGQVGEILAADGTPVEYGEPLVVLMPCEGH